MQSDLPPLPEMKPMPAAPSPASQPEPTERPAQRGAPNYQAAMPFGRRLRQVLGILAGGGIIMVTGIGALEMVAKPEFRPSTLIATFEAGTEISIMNQKLGIAPGEKTYTEADYRSALAKAEREGQASAELAFQKELAVVQSDKERIVQAYGSLYQRVNMIAQAALQLETIAQQFRQQLLQMTTGGRGVVIGMKDLFCGLGSPEACASARADRETMISEADELSRGDAGQRVRELLSGIDDPATIAVQGDRQRTPTFGTPSQP